MSVTFPQKYDSMRWTQTLVDEAGASGPDAASLAAIESLMLTANTAFWNRHYAEAIDDTSRPRPRSTVARIPRPHLGVMRQAHQQHEPQAVARVGVTRHRLRQGLLGPPYPDGLTSCRDPAVRRVGPAAVSVCVGHAGNGSGRTRHQQGARPTPGRLSQSTCTDN
jgi:hypothetical protein